MKGQSTLRSDNLRKKATSNMNLNNSPKDVFTELWGELVITEEDKDIYQDTFLRLSIFFDGQQPLKDSFKGAFRQIKRCYKRCDRAEITKEVNDIITYHGIYTQKED